MSTGFWFAFWLGFLVCLVLGVGVGLSVRFWPRRRYVA